MLWPRAAIVLPTLQPRVRGPVTRPRQPEGCVGLICSVDSRGLGAGRCLALRLTMRMTSRSAIWLVASLILAVAGRAQAAKDKRPGTRAMELKGGTQVTLEYGQRVDGQRRYTLRAIKADGSKVKRVVDDSVAGRSKTDSSWRSDQDPTTDEAASVNKWDTSRVADTGPRSKNPARIRSLAIAEARDAVRLKPYLD